MLGFLFNEVPLLFWYNEVLGVGKEALCLYRIGVSLREFPLCQR
jgi:hypothetical protein